MNLNSVAYVPPSVVITSSSIFLLVKKGALHILSRPRTSLTDKQSPRICVVMNMENKIWPMVSKQVT